MSAGQGQDRGQGRDLGSALVCESAEAAAQVAAGHIVRAAKVAVHERGRFLLALCGGETPAHLYRLLAGTAYDDVIDWPRTHLLWGDERCVAPDHARSNYGLAQRSGLLARHLGGVHRMEGELDPGQAAARYEGRLRLLAPEGGHLRLDVALLGVGLDGHTASLFPGSPEVEERERWVVATAAHGGSRRLTLTLPLLWAARWMILLVTGGKADVIASLFSGESGLPAALAAAGAPRATWILDPLAAAGVCRGAKP